MKRSTKLAFGSLLALALSCNISFASECSMEINSNDQMQFDTAEMVSPAGCKTLTITLNHTGTLPAAAMGHNWVLTKAADFQDVANAALTGSLENNYIPVGDERVIAGSKVIGGGESTQVTVDLSGLSADEEYTFFCSFPGHWSIMKGSFKVS